MNTAKNDQSAEQAESQRDRADVMADAIRVLTEAARLRRPVMHRTEDGTWEEDPGRTEPADWADFVTQALAGAAANIGSVHAVLAGRPGSWEADKIGDLLHSTVGYDEQYLIEHRTEPVRVVVSVEQILSDLGVVDLYDDSEDTLYQLQDNALDQLDDEPHHWTYTRTAEGEFVADEPDAPAWSIEAWRASVAATSNYDAEQIDELQRYVLNDPMSRGAGIVKSPEAALAVRRLGEQEAVITAEFEARFEALAAQRVSERATYAEAFTAHVRQEAERRYPGTLVEVDVSTDPSDAHRREVDEWDFYGSPETHLIEHATEHTPLPGSGLAPQDYPNGTHSIYDTETAAGRLPYLRLNTTNDQQERR